MVKESFRVGWQKFKENWKLLLGVQFLSLLVSSLLNVATNNIPTELWYVSLVVYLVTVVLGIVMGIGLIKIYLKIFDGEKATLTDLFVHFKLGVKFVLAQILSGLVSGVSALPLILVVVLLTVVNNSVAWAVGAVFILVAALFIAFVSIRMMFVQYLVVDKEMGPIAAVKGSFGVTRGHVLTLVGFGLLSFLVALLSLVALFVGLFAAIPVIALATVAIYRELSK